MFLVFKIVSKDNKWMNDDNSSTKKVGTTKLYILKCLVTKRHLVHVQLLKQLNDQITCVSIPKRC